MHQLPYSLIDSHRNVDAVSTKWRMDKNVQVDQYNTLYFSTANIHACPLPFSSLSIFSRLFKRPCSRHLKYAPFASSIYTHHKVKISCKARQKKLEVGLTIIRPVFSYKNVYSTKKKKNSIFSCFRKQTIVLKKIHTRLGFPPFSFSVRNFPIFRWDPNGILDLILRSYSKLNLSCKVAFYREEYKTKRKKSGGSSLNNDNVHEVYTSVSRRVPKAMHKSSEANIENAREREQIRGKERRKKKLCTRAARNWRRQRVQR